MLYKIEDERVFNRTKAVRRGCRGCLWLAVGLIVVASLPFFWRTAVKWYYQRHIYAAELAPTQRTAIVFGAAVYGNGRLSPILRDRVETAVQLYKSGQVDKILMSGDNQTVDYDEPSAMVAYAVAQGVPPEDVQPDYGGRRTYDTCFRARDIFHVEKAILVTQAFHLPRALFTCRQLGVTAVGVSADLQPYRGARWYELRETGATLVALWDVVRQNPPPVLGDPLPLE
ncbi:MAG: YdcF family protein [Chloroflexi bacterium]|nr:YdcF family protein [Chloroflexota bacterium]MBK6711783.1 YdcF family protein [Chloroflexota bacterium]